MPSYGARANAADGLLLVQRTRRDRALAAVALDDARRRELARRRGYGLQT